ncbi:VOC family protein [Niabella ginsengisoli]|uniref:VOC family protein n=1 Tax=Niabella ginsengisoli TaxID=522298 RepID=A0ABS9SJT4_9BACT|nr:VOC family protein [Niabella ginsengisoli]MCH5598607.1 VOC family protein [Niabella ginsengisoli]
MNNNIYPCVWFDNNGSEAARFYCDIFPNTKIVDDTGMVQMLSIDGQSLMFLTAGPMFKPNASISFLIANEDENESERLFNALAEDGIVLMPLDSYPFSSKYGWVRDKFGVTWQLYTGEKGNTDQYFVPTLMYVNEQNGRAKKAIDFYTNLFPNSKTEGIMEYDGKEDTKGNVQHAQFHIDGFTLACMDSSISHAFNFDEGISLTVLTDDQKETDYYWNAMVADGGAESNCGWLKDKFGVSWQIIPKRLLELVGQSDKHKAKKSMDAMMTMHKIDIEKLEAANV